MNKIKFVLFFLFVFSFSQYSTAQGIDIDDAFDPYGLYSARPDYRECLAPACGGWFVKKLNKTKLRCADGSRQRECYVASANLDDFDFSEARTPAFDNQTPYIFRGSMSLQAFDGFGDFAVFEASEIFQSISDETATGRFWGLENLGIFCITNPCFSYEAHALNRNKTRSISLLDFSGVDAEEESIENLQMSLADGDIVLLAGRTRSIEELAGRGRQFVASQAYEPIPLAISEICEEGYTFIDGACRTPYGCEFPLIELTGVGGAAFVDPVTGEPVSNETKSCVSECEFPAELTGPGQCLIFYP